MDDSPSRRRASSERGAPTSVPCGGRGGLAPPYDGALVSLCSQFGVPAGPGPDPRDGSVDGGSSRVSDTAWSYDDDPRDVAWHGPELAAAPLQQLQEELAAAAGDGDDGDAGCPATEAWRSCLSSAAQEEAAPRDAAANAAAAAALGVSSRDYPVFTAAYTGRLWRRTAVSESAARGARRVGAVGDPGLRANLCVMEASVLSCLADDAATVQIGLGDLELSHGDFPVPASRCRRMDSAWPRSFALTELGKKAAEAEAEAAARPAADARHPWWPQALAARTRDCVTDVLRRATGGDTRPGRRGGATTRPGSFARLLLCDHNRVPGPRTAGGDAGADAGLRFVVEQLRRAPIETVSGPRLWTFLSQLYSCVGALYGRAADGVLDHTSLRQRAGASARPAAEAAGAAGGGGPLQGLVGIHVAASRACSILTAALRAESLAAAEAAALDAVTFASRAVLGRVDDWRTWARLLETIENLDLILAGEEAGEEAGEAEEASGEATQEAAEEVAPAAGGEAKAAGGHAVRGGGIGTTAGSEPSPDATSTASPLAAAAAQALCGGQGWAQYVVRSAVVNCVEKLTSRHPLTDGQPRSGVTVAALLALTPVGVVLGVPACAYLFVTMSDSDPRSAPRLTVTVASAVVALVRVYLSSSNAGGQSSLWTCKEPHYFRILALLRQALRPSKMWH